MNISLTRQAHKYIAKILHKGELAIDATCGNGHDTVFLARTVGDKGVIYGFDIQASAIENTQQRLEQADLKNVVLIKQCHSMLSDWIQSNIEKPIKVIMFNLGYLPGSDKNIMTKKKSTLIALNDAVENISNGGLITILVYPGHDGGKLEADAVLEWVNTLSISHYRNEIIFSDKTNDSSPILICVYKISAE